MNYQPKEAAMISSTIRNILTTDEVVVELPERIVWRLTVLGATHPIELCRQVKRYAKQMGTNDLHKALEALTESNEQLRLVYADPVS